LSTSPCCNAPILIGDGTCFRIGHEMKPMTWCACQKCGNVFRSETVEKDSINHPAHYTSSRAKCECGRTIECIDVARHQNFNIGNIIKYLWRCDQKGDALENLKKAAWYLQDEINRRTNKKK
jgi:hypothetical protein